MTTDQFVYRWLRADVVGGVHVERIRLGLDTNIQIFFEIFRTFQDI